MLELSYAALKFGTLESSKSSHAMTGTTGLGCISVIRSGIPQGSLCGANCARAVASLLNCEVMQEPAMHGRSSRLPAQLQGQGAVLAILVACAAASLV